MTNLKLGFSDCEREYQQCNLVVQGEIPSWLNGVLLRNGPAKFHAGPHRLNHWFDGYAMLQQFKFSSGSVNYTNRFIQSNAFQKAKQYKKNCYEEFASLPNGNWIDTLKRIIHPMMTDNTNVNTMTLKNEAIALTETCSYNAFDLHDLSTKGSFCFDDQLPGHITTAHPQYDAAQQVYYNFTIEIGFPCHYYFYRCALNSKTRQLLVKIPVKSPAYLHSFAMTEHYLILIESPLRLKVGQFIFSRKAFIENYRWRSELMTQLTVIDKKSGKIILKTETDPFFMFHQINAYEKENDLCIDLPCYTDNAIINSLYLDKLGSGLPSSAPMRLLLNLKTKKIVQKKLAECFMELPRINERVAGDAYQFVYGCSKKSEDDFITQLIKLNVENGEHLVWREENCYVSEPVFVAHPEEKAEDAGLILSIIIDTQKKSSYLLILDAMSFTELTRVILPHSMPFGFHGQFIRFD